MDPRLHLLGIRHHGPGSAASLVAALEAIDPAIVLIEGAPEADGLIPYVAAPGMKPPLALLFHAVDDPGLALFEPFAEFSPEWQAMRWAVAKGRPARFIDLPAAVTLAVRAAALKAAADDEDSEEAEFMASPEAEVDSLPDPDPDPDPAPTAPVDPLDRLAEIAGYSDGEAWWNALVESRSGSVAVFSAILEAMAALRADVESAVRGSAEERLRETRREARMRLEIRKALAETKGPVVAVVGAWHVPALAGKAVVADDRAALRDLPSVKVDATWVPWTDGRLASASGYGAGIRSPGWYRHLWTLYERGGAASPIEFAASWQARVAATLREAGHAGATASAIEAAHLAIGLSALRGRAVPGLAEMRDATLAALCHGDETPFRLIEQKLFIGERVGEIDESVPQMPLAADLARWQRKARLKPEALEQDIGLDLRSEAGLLKSTLLHRLTLIDVPWGRLMDAASGRGTFREIWKLAWVPELSVALAEALVHGVTIEQAAAGAAEAKGRRAAAIADHAELVRQCLLADLPDAAERCIATLQAAAVDAADIAGLMLAVPPLAAILRYGTARKIPEAALSALVRALAVEVNAGLVGAARNLDLEASSRLRGAMVACDGALGLLETPHLAEEWSGALARLVEGDGADALASGFALRHLHDRQRWPIERVVAAFSLRLSRALPPALCGAFLEGFLGASADVLVHDRALFSLVDEWLGGLEETAFIEILPMTRRGFSSFDAMGRRRLLQGLDAPEAGIVAIERALDPAFEKALPLLLDILGITPDD